LGEASVRALLAIDAGSSRTRVTLLSSDGRMFASAAAASPVGRPRPGEAVLAGGRLWRQVVALVRELPTTDVELVGIGVAAQLGVVLVDAQGAAVDDALLWPDGRAAREAAELAERIAPLRGLLGRPVSAELPACKALWWARHRPDAAAAARWLLSLKDFLVMKLTGEAVTDETHASYSGWFDVAARAYADELVERSGVDARLLPPVRGAGEAAGALRAEAAAALGLSAGVPVAVGAPDGTAGALGAGAVGPGTTVDVAGTTDVLLSVVERPRWDPRQQAVLNAYALPGCWVLGGPTGMTGGAVEWVARLLGFSSASDAFERLGAEAMALPAGAEGVRFDPALSGSRFPLWDGAERGMLAGLAPHHSPAHVLRAAHEGAAFVVLEGIEAVRAAGASVEEVVIVGGVARRPELVRLRSELWSLPVRVVAGGEATTVGTAMLAGIAAGAFADAASAAAALAGSAELVAGSAQEAPDGVARARRDWRATVAAARSLAAEEHVSKT
jgi:xylulokinase